MKKKKVTILGSTGSIGTQALEVIQNCKQDFEILALACGHNIELIKKQIKLFHPKKVCVNDSQSVKNLQEEFKNVEFLCGEEGLIELCSDKNNDIILVAVSGKIGLKPTLTAIDNKIDIALANKETLVMAGDIVMSKAKKNNVQILPVDSEHSAIHQCIKNPNDLKSLIITASGGPFRNKSIQEMQQATLQETLAHPRWTMGKKITVDSATLMNKGLEVIEAHHLFNFDYNNIKVVIHPESVVHSAVEYKDGSVIAQLGLPSMHIPIQYALTYPERVEGIKTDSFDFAKIVTLNFQYPDYKKFPALKLAYDSGKSGGTYNVCLNASNEEAVFAFLNGKIKFSDIVYITQNMLDNYDNIINPSIDDIILEDEKIRAKTRHFINNNLYSKE